MPTIFAFKVSSDDTSKVVVIRRIAFMTVAYAKIIIDVHGIWDNRPIIINAFERIWCESA